MLVTCQKFDDLFFGGGLVWQYSSVPTKYNKGRFKVMAAYLQQYMPIYIYNSSWKVNIVENIVENHIVIMGL